MDGKKQSALRNFINGGNGAVVKANEKRSLIPSILQDPLRGDSKWSSDEKIRENKKLLLDYVKQNQIQDDVINDSKRLEQHLVTSLGMISPGLHVSGVTAVVTQAMDELTGLGPLEPLIQNPNVNNIFVISHDQIYADEKGLCHLTNLKFDSYDHALQIIQRIVQRVGRKIDTSDPIVDARTKQGYRINAIIEPIALSGVSLTIRKFPDTVFSALDLIKFGAAPPVAYYFLKANVEERKNIAVSGGTGSGKTTTLNALSWFIDENEHIMTIEDVAELKLRVKFLERFETRPANLDGKGAVTMSDIIVACLRKQPDRIIVGECRRGEALDMLQAMNTGHDGSMTTGHANTPPDFCKRIEYMCLMSGIDMPLKAIRECIASALHLIVQVAHVKIPTTSDILKNLSHAEKDLKFVYRKKMVTISEVVGLDQNDKYIINDLFTSNYKGENPYELKWTGNLPTYFDEMDFDIQYLTGEKEVDLRDLMTPEELAREEKKSVCGG